MPQFVLNKGDAASAKWFDQLDDFTKGYVEVMFWLTVSRDSFSLSMLAPETRTKIIAECKDFQDSLPRDSLKRSALDLAYDYAAIEYDAHRAGIDLWLTRNG